MGSRVLVTWDVGGQTSLRPMWDKYFSEAHAVVFVVDAASDEERLEEARATFAGVASDPRLVGAPIMLLCNKMDKAGAASPDTIAALFGIDAVRDHTVLVAPIVALTATGIEDAFEWLLADLRANPRHIDQS